MSKFKIGGIYTNKQNEEYVILENLGKYGFKVKFIEDDFIKRIPKSSIEKGYVKNTNKHEDKYSVGKIFKNNEGSYFEITSYVDEKRRIIKYLDKFEYEVEVLVTNILNGGIKNPFHPSVNSIGYFGVGEYVGSINNIKTKEYMNWKNILNRCYCPKELLKKPHTLTFLSVKSGIIFKYLLNGMKKTTHIT